MDPAAIGASFPFDVLGIIFSYYVDEETIEFPLETLLFVCRSWNEATLGHRNLWARLKIYLGHFPTSELWNMRLPRRLEQAGDSTLLEIDLRCILESRRVPQEVNKDHHRCFRPIPNTLGDRGCDCVATARRTAKELLIILAGPQGELCCRWKSLYLCLGSSNPLGKEMTYPTPNLEAVRLERSSCEQDISILPSIPKVKTLEIFDPHSMKLPKIETVQNLVIVDFGGLAPLDLSNLKTATNLQTLTINMRINVWTYTPYCLPQFLPRLSSMSFIGNYFPSHLNEVQAPNIRRLSLRLDNAMRFQTFIDSSLPFWDLQELELTWPSAHRAEYERLRMVTSVLLLLCINITRIKGERKSLSAIVKLYSEECTTRSIGREDIIGKTLSFWSNDSSRDVTVRRPLGKSELEGVALSLGLIPPCMSWDYMLARL